MIVVDSSGWLEFLTDGVLADEYAKRLRLPATVVTPTIILYEEGALDAVAAMQKTRVCGEHIAQVPEILEVPIR